ncbi:unnamed protein product [Sphagnum troendelagicum]|uniref:Glycosyl transferase 64 domain-containing protein n=1 Tax=Sphagnum troendelagicum TaxID=128251 RepID=A0ABP0TAW3_9BRYO
MKGTRDRLWVRWRPTLLVLCQAGPCRVKLLSLFCIVSVVILAISRAASIMGWRHHLDSPQLPSRHQYTVLINTWRRNDLLKKSVAHYTQCNGVNAIRVVWSEPEPPSNSLHLELVQSVEASNLHNNNRHNHKISFQFDTHETDDLNNRFKPLNGLHTDAIFSIDDDVVVPCALLEFSFGIWLSAPDSMVGFVPRMHWVQSMKHAVEQEKYTYGGWWSVWWMGSYSMILSKAAFIHHKYFELYTHQMPASIHQYVREARNCEDIAMSFLVANATSAPPLWVKGRLFEIGSTGISSLQGHSEHRTQCVNHFVSVYGYMPLVASHVKVVDAQHQWLW